MKRKFALLLALVTVLTTIFTITAFPVKAAAEPASVDPNQLEVGTSLPTKTTRNLVVDEEADFGDIYSTYNNTSSRAVMKVEQENGENYVAMRASNNVAANYILNTSVLTNKIPNGSVVKIKLVFRPTEGFTTNASNESSRFILRLDSTKNDMRFGSVFTDEQFDGETWLTYETEFTLKADCKYVHFYNYAKPGHGCDIKSIEITYLGDRRPEITTTSYDYDSASKQDLAVSVDTKAYAIEGLLVKGPEDADMHMVARNAYSLSEDFKTLTINSSWLRALTDGKYTFTIQIEETFYKFTVNVTGYVPEPVTDPTTEPVTEPVTEPMTEPVTEPMTEPVTDPVTEPTPANNSDSVTIVAIICATVAVVAIAAVVIVLKKKR